MSSCKILRRSVKPLRRYGDFRYFHNCDRPPSWICYEQVSRTHEEYLVAFIAVQNGNRCSSFDNMQVLIFNEFGLKIPIHAPKMEVLGIIHRKMGSSLIAIPRAPPCVETRHTTYISVQPFFAQLTLLSSRQHHMLCNGPYTHLKVPLPVGASVPHLIYGSLCPRNS